MTPKLIYIEWWDAIQHEGASTGPNPSPALFKGYTTLVDESVEDIVVAHFMTDDAAFFDRIAIPRRCVVRLDYITGIYRANVREELRHGY